MKPRVLAFLLLVGTLLLVGLRPAAAQTPVPGGHPPADPPGRGTIRPKIEPVRGELNSVQAPTGYRPRTMVTPQSGLAATDAADILLIQTALPWDSDANFTVLNSLGYSYDVVDMSNLGTVNLFSYPVVLIVNDQDQAFYDTYASQVATFEAYVTAGGVLLFFAASDGWALGTLQANLPGGVEVVTPHYEDYNYIADSSHPIVTGELSDGQPLVNSDLYNTFCSHGYFTSLLPGTVVVFEDQHEDPTLIDYQLGAGRVIASTNTWEHAYLHNQQPFALKALDDVFLYAFSGGSSIVANLSVDLHVEDAPDDVLVRKSRGSYVDVVAELKGSQAYQPAVTLEVTDDKLGSPVKTFTRNLANDSGYGQENAYQNLGSGRYKVETTLVAVALNNQSTYHKEVVWRFKVPDNAAFADITLKATATQAGAIITHNTDTGVFKIVDRGNALVVTNRKRLFEVHGQGNSWNTVQVLLQQVYRAATQETGEVFYLDRYGVSWSQTTDENAANTTVESIDDRVEEWYTDLTSEVVPALKPDYLLIVGGDEIVPFYRADDDDYSMCSLSDCEDDGWANNNANLGPLWDVYEDNYFLTDNIYADIGGDKRNWENGDLELALGRIVGTNADSMRKLIQNGYRVTDPLRSAGLSSVGGFNIGDARDALQNRSITIHGLANPDITENDAWRPTDFKQVWQRDWQYFLFGSHANPLEWATGEKKNYDMESIPRSDLLNSHIADNRSLLFSTGCNFAVPLSDGLTHFLVDQGFSGIVGSTGLSLYNSADWISTGGEKLSNQYIQVLSTPSNSTQRFGEALRIAKRDYDPLSGGGRKTMLEYVYYGLPWTFARFADDNLQQAIVPPRPTGYAIALSQPTTMALGNYQVELTASVVSYSLQQVEGYDLLVIEGAEMVTDAAYPALPYVMQTVFLPPGSSVTGLSLQSEHSVALGTKTLPALEAVSTYDDSSGVLPFTGTSAYPSPTRWSYQVVDFPDYTAVEVMIYLASYNGATDVLTLFDSTNLLLSYSTEASAVIKSFEVSQPSYLIGESVQTVTEVQNVTGQSIAYTAQLTLFDAAEAIVQQIDVPTFNVAAGATYPLEISGVAPMAAGPYQATLAIFEAALPVVAGQDSFAVVDGEVSGFDAPAEAAQGEYTDITLTFNNHRGEATEIVAEVLILDQGVEVGKLLQRTTTVEANSAGFLTWSWDPAAFALGPYTLRAVVTSDGFSYFAPQRDIVVKEPDGQTQFNVSGTITNIDTGDPIADVNIYDPDYPDNYATTDADGHYTLELESGTYHLRAEHYDWYFLPETRAVTVGPNRTGIDFEGHYLGSYGAWFIPTDDAYVDQAKKTTNYGSSPILRVKNAAADANAYLKYEVDGFEAEPGQCYQFNYSALVNHVKEPSADGGAIYSVGNNWSEGSINWNNAPPITGSPLGSFGAVVDESTAWGFMYGALYGNGTYSFAIQNASTDAVDYSSKEGQYHPWLYVNYSDDFDARLTAEFGYNTSAGLAPLTVQFNDYSYGCPTSWLWDFGDGATSTERNPTHTYTAVGSYDVSLTVTNDQGSDQVAYYGAIDVVAPPNLFYLSLSKPANVGGIAAQPADIVRYNKAANGWSMVYDGSDHGTTKNVGAFSFTDEGDLLLVFSANQAIPGLGTATARDIVRFTPNAPWVFPLGAGTWSWHLRGSTPGVGLTTGGETIDAIDDEWGDLNLSTSGAASLPTSPITTAADEDVLYWSSWDEVWYGLSLDGSTIPGMAAEDVNGFWDDTHSADYYITIPGKFNLGGVAGNDASIVRLAYNVNGYTPSLFPWLAPGAVFKGKIDAIELGR